MAIRLTRFNDLTLSLLSRFFAGVLVFLRSVLPAQAKCNHCGQGLQDKGPRIINPDCSDDTHPSNERKKNPLNRAGFPSLESKRRPKQAESKKAVVECRVQPNVCRLS